MLQQLRVRVAAFLQDDIQVSKDFVNDNEIIIFFHDGSFLFLGNKKPRCVCIVV